MAGALGAIDIRYYGPESNFSLVEQLHPVTPHRWNAERTPHKLRHMLL